MKGFLISIPQRYEDLALRNLKRLRERFKIDLPVEIWEAGQEISDQARAELRKIPNVSFRNVADTGESVGFWRGFQIKALMCQYTAFDEFILVDADATFVQNPLKIWKNRGYRATGSYYFRDRILWKYQNLKAGGEGFSSLEKYQNRVQWLKGLMPQKSPYFPRQWAYVYGEGVPTKPVLEAYMESGVVYLDRSRQQAVIDKVFELNKNHAETYRYVHGDKETFWIANCLTGTPFTMNPLPPYMNDKLTQLYHLRPFYFQK